MTILKKEKLAVDKKYKCLDKDYHKLKKKYEHLKLEKGNNHHPKSPRRGHHSHTRISEMEIRRYENIIYNLKEDIKYFKSGNYQLENELIEIKQRTNKDSLEKKLESEKSKNIYLEKELVHLNKQIRDLKQKYRDLMDERNKNAVRSFVHTNETVLSENTINLKFKNTELIKKNQELVIKLKSLSKKLYSYEKYHVEIQTLRVQKTSLDGENKFLKQQNDNFQREINSLKLSLSQMEMQLKEVNHGSDHMVQMYQKLYNDKKNENQIYLDKITDLTNKLQFNQNNKYSVNEEVYQSKFILDSF